MGKILLLGMFVRTRSCGSKRLSAGITAFRLFIHTEAFECTLFGATLPNLEKKHVERIDHHPLMPGAPKTHGKTQVSFHLQKTWFLGTKNKVFDGLGCSWWLKSHHLTHKAFGSPRRTRSTGSTERTCHFAMKTCKSKQQNHRLKPETVKLGVKPTLGENIPVDSSFWA